MNKGFVLLLIAIFIITIQCSKTNQTDQSDLVPVERLSLDTQEQKTSYAMGYNMGSNFKEIYQDIHQDSLIRGLIDAIKEEEPMIPRDQITSILMELQQKVNQQKQVERKDLADKNKILGKEFLEKNAKKPGIEVTTSGLQYQIIKKGTGSKPKSTDRVKVNYRGNLINGTEFDSSYKRNQPASFGLNEVIPGWTEALQLMNVGSKYIFYIPSELAYGERGAGNVIGPNETLIFEVELLEIISPDSK
jgi:FKBP-type peptidyl-prolyl cis-trans isomerase FklB